MDNQAQAIHELEGKDQNTISIADWLDGNRGGLDAYKDEYENSFKNGNMGVFAHIDDDDEDGLVTFTLSYCEWQKSDVKNFEHALQWLLDDDSKKD